MKKIFLIPVTLFVLCMVSCKDKNVFTISGAIEHPGDVKKVFLMAADSTNISVVDSTTVSEQGKFEFKHFAPYANLYRLRIGGTTFDLIAKNGDDIDFKTDYTDTKHVYDISGSSESEKIKEYNRVSNIYGDTLAKISADFETKAEALGHESDSLRNAIMPTFLKYLTKQSEAVLKFANDNQNSLAGFYAVYSLDADKYEQQKVAYADAIKDKFADNPTVQTFIKQMASVKPISIGHQAPDFTTGGIDGKPVKLSDYKGKYVMLDFWASWCGPCRQENPNVVKQYAIFHDKGLNILGISLDTDQPAWKQAIAQDKLTWQHASDLQKFDGPTEKLYHIEAIPSNFIIDPKGVIVAKNIRGTELEEFLKKTFPKS